MPTARRLVGRDELGAPPEHVEVGRLEFDIDGGALRTVRLDGVEIIRSLLVAVRDVAWDTIPGVVGVECADRSDDRVEYRLRASHRQGAIDFSWTGTLVAEAGGALEFTMDGVTNGEFDYARIGIVLLGPDSFGGYPFKVVTPAGIHAGVLPQVEIAAQAGIDGEFYAMTVPFDSLSVYLPPGEMRFDLEGDLFEMEDHRNWTDASFKIYSTPMALGNHRAQPGGAIRQSLRFTPPAPGRVTPRRRGKAGRVTVGPIASLALPRPAVGLCHTHGGHALSGRERQLLGALGPAHLRADVHLADDPRSALDAAAGDAAQLGCGLELAVHLPAGGDTAGLDAVVDAAAGLPVQRMLVFQDGTLATPAGPTALAREQARGRIPVFAGTELNFAEINRDRPDPALNDGVMFAISPQIHDPAERSMMETVSVHADVVRAARVTFAAERPIAVGPITLLPRFNPDALDGPPDPGPVPAAVDVRQPTLFCAAWTVGSLAHLAAAGADSATYFGTIGWEGVIEREEGSPAPQLFASNPGEVYPVYHVLRAFCELADATVSRVAVGDPAAVAAVAVHSGAVTRLIAANLTPGQATLAVSDGGPATVRILDQTTVEQAVAAPEAWAASGSPAQVASLELGAYGTAIIDYGRDAPAHPPGG